MSALRLAIVTGSRADFGLLEPVIGAARAEPGLDVSVVVAGAHLLDPAQTWRDVDRAGIPIAARVEVQLRPGGTRLDDAEALGRGTAAFARLWSELQPDWALVLGDRVEALAAGATAAVGGIALAHVHGGDRAEGLADESMRHAISKLAHLHLAATAQSADRLVRMGEDAARVLVVGSPALDALAGIAPMDDRQAASLGDPRQVILLHPAGLDPDKEARCARAVAGAAARAAGRHVLVLAPNTDPGREAIDGALAGAATQHAWARAEHLERPRFLALLRRLASSGGVLVGNSSAGLIEAAAIRLPVVNVGPRQDGRERAHNCLDVPLDAPNLEDAIAQAIDHARTMDRAPLTHPFGDGHAGERIARAMAAQPPRGTPAYRTLLRKRNSY